MQALIRYFTFRPLLSNALFFGVLVLGVVLWGVIGKEEMPEFESNWIRVSTTFPGAPPEDVELFVTKPIEEELQDVLGIEEISSTSSQSVSSIRIVVDDNFPDQKQVVQDIKDAVLRVQLPTEVREIPSIRQFKSAEKAILDIGFFLKGVPKLDDLNRKKLQSLVLSFENQVKALPEISSITKSHYLKPELQILLDPQSLKKNDISINNVRQSIVQNHTRAPLGKLKNKGESQVSARYELEDETSMKNLIVQGNFSNRKIKLGDMGIVRESFSESSSIFKINGHEGVFLNVRKSTSTDILSAQEKLNEFIEKFKKMNPRLGIVLMDDESYSVRNRLDIIGSNGVLGFGLIILVLFLFLNMRIGFWVAMGVPFSAGVTLLFAHLWGYTVNNMTLAGIIIVLGIVVDDAIIIAENIGRYLEAGLKGKEAAVKGALEVVKPIFASVITTCVAFVPLIYFEGFFGKLVSYIPLVVILMLAGSLLESILILPSHMAHIRPPNKGWFKPIEERYQAQLEWLLNRPVVVFSGFALFLLGAGLLYAGKMKFVMFPREEGREVFVKIKTKPGSTRDQTAEIIAPLEKKAASDKVHVVGVRSSVGLSRRGGEVKENEASVLIEIVPPSQRERGLKDLMREWEDFAKGIEGIQSARFLKGRWGWDSGNSIEFEVSHNSDMKRDEMLELIEKKLKEDSELIDVEVERPLEKQEVILELNQDSLIRYEVTSSQIQTALKAAIGGNHLYALNKGEEEVDVILSILASSQGAIEDVLNLNVSNTKGLSVQLGKLVTAKPVKKPLNILRVDGRRITKVYANLKEGSEKTPLQVADELEDGLFSDLQLKYPLGQFRFRGEIEDSRESGGEFLRSVLLVVLSIYVILLVLFDSALKPFLVLSIVPFGVAGVIYVLWIHGMNVYGFFAVIGALGMVGVVVNDAIVMIDKFDRSLKSDSDANHKTDQASRLDPIKHVASIAKTRLRPVILTTVTTVIGVLPTAYGIAGYDSMLAEMMLTMGWGLLIGTAITLLLIPSIYLVFFTENRRSKL